MIGIQWKPEVLSQRSKILPASILVISCLWGSDSHFLFSVEQSGSQKPWPDDSQHTGMPALYQPASMVFSVSHSASFWTTTIGCWSLLCRKNRGQSGSCFFLPTAKCNLIVCFVGTDAEVNLTCADKMPAVGILSGIQKWNSWCSNEICCLLWIWRYIW